MIASVRGIDAICPIAEKRTKIIKDQIEIGYLNIEGLINELTEAKFIEMKCVLIQLIGNIT